MAHLYFNSEVEAYPNVTNWYVGVKCSSNANNSVQTISRIWINDAHYWNMYFNVWSQGQHENHEHVNQERE